MESRVRDLLEQIARVNELALWDYTAARIDEHTLLVLGSHDFAYYHDLELEFRGVTFCDLPDQFSHAEWMLIGYGDGGMEIGIVAESLSGAGTGEYRIRALEMTVRVGKVYYYNRKDLKPGEKIASWVDS